MNKDKSALSIHKKWRKPSGSSVVNLMGSMLTSPLYPRSGPLSPTSLSFSYYFNCICNDYNAQSSNNIIILNLCLQLVSGKWRELLKTCTKTLMCKHLRHPCLRCSCLKHACIDLLCKRALTGLRSDSFKSDKRKRTQDEKVLLTRLGVVVVTRCPSPPKIVVLKNKPSLGGLEPPTFRLTAERANRLRHRDLMQI